MKTEEIERLEKLGLKSAASKVKLLKERARKLAIAYEHYRFVKKEKIDAFDSKLLEESRKKDGSYKILSFSTLEDYDKVPPSDVLMALEVAQGKDCFDSFEIAYIREVKDPILFGNIKGCTDRFFIAQWDDDVKIEDIIGPNEG